MGEVRNVLSIAKQLTQARDFQAVDSLLGGLPEADLREDLELCIMLASAWNNMFRHEAAKQLLDDTQAIFFRSRDKTLIRRWLNLAAIPRIHQGALDPAEALLQESLASAQMDEHQRHIAYASNNLGIVASIRGDVELSVRHYNRAMAAWLLLGDQREIGATHHNIGVVLREWGKAREALSHFSVAGEFFSQYGIIEERIFTAGERAIALQELGDTLMAERLARSAVKRADELSNDYLSATALKVLGLILLANEELVEARLCLMEAKKRIARLSSRQISAEIHEELAILEAAEGNNAAAQLYRQIAIELYRDIGARKHSDRFEARFEANLVRT